MRNNSLTWTEVSDRRNFIVVEKGVERERSRTKEDEGMRKDDDPRFLKKNRTMTLSGRTVFKFLLLLGLGDTSGGPFLVL